MIASLIIPIHTLIRPYSFLPSPGVPRAQLATGACWEVQQHCAGQGHADGNSKAPCPFCSSQSQYTCSKTAGVLVSPLPEVWPLVSRGEESQRQQLFPAAHFPLICHGLWSCSCLTSVPFGSYRGRDSWRSKFLSFGLFHIMLKKPWMETSQLDRSWQILNEFKCLLYF